MHDTSGNDIRRAAGAVASADALVIGAGAGMGVDSGLPDFRGDQGFWRAYPPYAKLGLRFVELAHPRWFRDDPELAWGFYGHRMNLYRAARPHDGFAVLRRWAARLPGGAFVATSNVDGQFQRAGFDPGRVWEVHGSIHAMQCVERCGVGIFAADPFEVAVDEETFRARGTLPVCPRCGALARPNILMFGDGDWDGARSAAQGDGLEDWYAAKRPARLVLVEIGAGQAVPTVRRFCEETARQTGGTLVRVNPREPEVPAGHVGLPMGAVDALRAIDACLGRGDLG